MQKMLPDKFKTMFGLKDEADLKMANNIWKMLDEMSSNDPQAYQKFISKNLTEGLTDAKQQKQKKQKPYKIVPNEYILLQMKAKLKEQLAEETQKSQVNQKFDMNINKQKWSDVKSKFSSNISIYLNICHSERVKNPISKSKNGEEIKNFNISMLKDIQQLYYSMQGPAFEEEKKNPNDWHYCMIFNSNFLKSFQVAPNGKKILLGLAIAYFQERIKFDRNPIQMKVNTVGLYGKKLYYEIEKQSIQISQGKIFKYGSLNKAKEFLLEREVDTKQRPNQNKNNKQKQVKIEQKTNKPKQILFKPKQQQESASDKPLPPLIPQQTKSKKVLIEVIGEDNNEDQSLIKYQLKQNQNGYQIEFFVQGIQKIDQLDLQVNKKIVKLKTIDKIPQKSVQVKLAKEIDEESVKAKMKKKKGTLNVFLIFQR